jgi:ribonucleotide monophosphatase NagD (HAD superfamily)
MVGDTLHTDVLGGRTARLGTVLVARHGPFRGLDPAPFISRSGITPDVIAATT